MSLQVMLLTLRSSIKNIISGFQRHTILKASFCFNALIEHSIYEGQVTFLNSLRDISEL